MGAEIFRLATTRDGFTLNVVGRIEKEAASLQSGDAGLHLLAPPAESDRWPECRDFSSPDACCRLKITLSVNCGEVASLPPLPTAYGQLTPCRQLPSKANVAL